MLKASGESHLLRCWLLHEKDSGRKGCRYYTYIPKDSLYLPVNWKKKKKDSTMSHFLNLLLITRFDFAESGPTNCSRTLYSNMFSLFCRYIWYTSSASSHFPFAASLDIFLLELDSQFHRPSYLLFDFYLYRISFSDVFWDLCVKSYNAFGVKQ